MKDLDQEPSGETVDWRRLVAWYHVEGVDDAELDVIDEIRESDPEVARALEGLARLEGDLVDLLGGFGADLRLSDAQRSVVMATLTGGEDDVGDCGGTDRVIRPIWRRTVGVVGGIAAMILAMVWVGRGPEVEQVVMDVVATTEPTSAPTPLAIPRHVEKKDLEETPVGDVVEGFSVIGDPDPPLVSQRERDQVGEDRDRAAPFRRLGVSTGRAAETESESVDEISTLAGIVEGLERGKWPTDPALDAVFGAVGGDKSDWNLSSREDEAIDVIRGVLQSRHVVDRAILVDAREVLKAGEVRELGVAGAGGGEGADFREQLVRIVDLLLEIDP